MRRHAKAPSAAETPGIGSSRGLFGRAFATRGGSSGFDGSGARSHRRSVGFLGLAGLVVVALAATLGGSASSAVAAGCPNEALRLQSNVNSETSLPFSLGLADCRAYEMISPLEKQAHDVRETKIMSADGDSVAFNIFGQLADGEGFNSFNYTGNSFLTKRSDAGWSTKATTAPGAIFQRITGVQYALDYSSDLSRYVSCGEATGNSGGGSADNAVCALHTPAGWISSPVYRTLDGRSVLASVVSYMGASDDLSHVVFAAPMKLLPADNYSGTNSSLYEIAGLGTASPTLRLVNLTSGGSQIAASGLTIGNGSDGYQAISDDGNTIYFTAVPVGGTVATVFARRDGATTTAVSNPSPPECTTCSATPSAAIYQGASADGSKVFFLTKQQLVNADTDTTQDLYEYDFDNPGGSHIIQVSGGGAGDLTPGAGANVSGVVRPSADGSHVYFVAPGVLTTLPNGNGQTATAGASNLYMFERDAAYPNGSTKFVATLNSGDSALWSAENAFRAGRTTPDGRFLVFSTLAALTPDDLDTAIDAYRYDAATGKVLRLSIGEPSYPASNNGNTAGKEAAIAPIYSIGQFGAQADINQRSNPVSDDGSYVIFSTPEQLQANDVNGVPDIYEWHDGSVSMISDGRDASSPIYGLQSVEAAMSADGADVMFNTRTQLTGSDTDDLLDLYDARIGGGLPYSPPPPLCPDVEACHGPAAQAATGVAAPGSATFSGPGNAVPSKPKKHKKHHKKHHKKQHPKRHSTGKRR